MDELESLKNEVRSLKEDLDFGREVSFLYQDKLTEAEETIEEYEGLLFEIRAHFGPLHEAVQEWVSCCMGACGYSEDYSNKAWDYADALAKLLKE